MRCRECGLEVDNDKAFCPVCGAPMKVTADYDYIQAEIANKVDRYFNEDKEEDPDDRTDDVSERDDYEEDEDSEIDPVAEDMSKTRDVYGSDSIYDEDEYPSNDRGYDSGINRPREADPHDVRTYNRPQRTPRRPVPRKKKKNQTAVKVITVLIIFVIIAAAVVGIMGILGMFNRNGNSGGTVSEQNRVSLTSNIKAGDTYDAPVTVELTNELGGNIFYTLDGTEPSINSKMYTGPFEIRGADVPSSYPSVNLRAVSYSETSEKSGDLNIVFELTYDEADAPKQTETEPVTEQEPETQAVLELSRPIITPASGDYTEKTDILVSSPENADIYYTYTTDGEIPDSNSERYTGPVEMIPGDSIFNAICIVNGRQSEVTSMEYSLDYGYFVTPDLAITNAAYWLFANGYTIDFDLNTAEGYAKVNHKGIYTIGDYTYYILQVDFYDGTDSRTDTQYLGVGINYGGVEHLERDGNTYNYN